MKIANNLSYAMDGNTDTYKRQQYTIEEAIINTVKDGWIAE